MSDEFRRLLDDAPDLELRSVLESGLSDQPSPRAITRAARSLGISAAGLVSARVAAAAASRALRASPWTALAKWGGAGFLLGGIVLSPVVLKTHAESKAKLTQQSAPRVSAPLAQSNARELAPTEKADAAESTVRAALGQNRAENSAVPRGESAAALAPAEAKPRAHTPVAGAAVSSAAVSSAASSHAAPQSTTRGVEAPTPASSVPDMSSATNAPRAPGAATRTDLLDNEITLLDSTRTALKRGDANAALALLDRHARLSTRTLDAEATLLRVQALVLAGRSAEARALARSALSGKSALPYAARLRKVAGLAE